MYRASLLEPVRDMGSNSRSVIPHPVDDGWMAQADGQSDRPSIEIASTAFGRRGNGERATSPRKRLETNSPHHQTFRGG